MPAALSGMSRFPSRVTAPAVTRTSETEEVALGMDHLLMRQGGVVVSGAIDEVEHFVIGSLREIVIPGAYRVEGFGRGNANDIVGDAAKASAGGTGGSRHGDDGCRRLLRAHSFDGRLHASAGRQTIVDEDDSAARKLWG